MHPQISIFVKEWIDIDCTFVALLSSTASSAVLEPYWNTWRNGENNELRLRWSHPHFVIDSFFFFVVDEPTATVSKMMKGRAGGKKITHAFIRFRKECGGRRKKKGHLPSAQARDSVPINRRNAEQTLQAEQLSIDFFATKSRYPNDNFSFRINRLFDPTVPPLNSISIAALLPVTRNARSQIKLRLSF